MQTLPKTPEERDQEQKTGPEPKKDKPGAGKSYYYDDAYGYEDYQPEDDKKHGTKESGSSTEKD